jgi:glycosyltransferase involved in cell wall biosynthesis
MIIAVNTRLLIKNRLEGIGWFIYESLKIITMRHPEHQFIFIFDRKFPEEFIFSDNVKGIVAYPPARHPVLWYLWFEMAVPSILKKYHADLFLSPDGFLSLNTNIKSASVIHDINFAHRPGDLPYLYRKYFNRFFPLYARKACRIATVSEYSKNDIASAYCIDRDMIDVVYNGANKIYTPLTNEEKATVRNQVSNGNEYFIFIGSLHPRKNVEGLLFAFDMYKETSSAPTKLVIVGEKMFRSGSVEKTLQSLTHRRDIIFTGRVEPGILRNLLGSALALTFVPYFEGFGVPVLEAMYCDVPVITSNLTSLPEVCGDAALLTDPGSAESVKDAMLKISADASLRSQLIEKGRIQRLKFSWEKTAELLWEFIEKALL